MTKMDGKWECSTLENGHAEIRGMLDLKEEFDV